MISSRLIERYGELKRQAPDCLLLMQVGAFLKVLGDDARAVSAITGLKLQMAGDVDEPVVVGGFPKSGLDAYVGRLVRAGHSVALALQDERNERHLEEVIRVSRGPKGRGLTVSTISPRLGSTPGDCRGLQGTRFTEQGNELSST
jgi:DNA mismatch repair ATPase MutS